MNNGMFFTLFSESIPCQMPLSVAFTLLYIDRRLSRKWSNTNTATAQIAVTTYPVAENFASMPSMLVPVLRKKLSKIVICASSVTPVTIITSSVSMARSVTTVPKAFGNDTPSHFFNTPQRVNSPTRGITRLAAYDRKMALTHVERRGFSPTGSRVCFHLMPLKSCAVIPNGSDSSIHVQSMSCSITFSMRLKSKSRYIQ